MSKYPKTLKVLKNNTFATFRVLPMKKTGSNYVRMVIIKVGWAGVFKSSGRLQKCIVEIRVLDAFETRVNFSACVFNSESESGENSLTPR